MSQVKQYILALLLLYGVSVFSQENTSQDINALTQTISFHIGQAELDVGRGNFFIAEENLQKALDMAEQIDDKKSKGIIHTKMAKIHFTLSKYDRAISSINKALEIQRLTNDYVNLVETYNVQGRVFAKKNEHKIALDSYTSAKSYAEIEELDEYIPQVLLNMGISWNAIEKYEKANEDLEKAIVLSKKFKNRKIESSALINNAKALFYLKKFDKALSKAQVGLDIAKQINYQEGKNEAFLIMSDIYQATENYQLANNYLNEHIRLKDSIYESQSDNLDAETALKYQISDKEKLFDKQTEELKKIKKDSNLKQLLSLLSIALITILSLLTLSLYKNNNIRTRTNNMLHKKNEDLVIAKEKAELASKTKANFLSTVTHELRTPLYAVTGLTNMLLDEDPKPDQVNHLKSLKFSGDYLLTFINDILQINKIEAKKVNIEPEIFNLKEKIENVISALNNSALDNNVKLHLEYDKNLPEVYDSDQVKISQILMNLIGNSIKFTKDGDIWVRVNKIDNKGDNYNIKFEVEDNGIGISQEKQEHMFESFSQGSIQINRKYGGTGLGLSIVKGLIDILKGKIYLKSELEKGTTFFFELPLLHSHEKIKVKKTNYFKDVNEIELSSIKILVVEDNKINQMITKKILNKMNLNCDMVDNGEDAVEKVKTENYDVVLMDIHMPGISGIEATKMIRIFDKELTIFALNSCYY